MPAEQVTGPSGVETGTEGLAPASATARVPGGRRLRGRATVLVASAAVVLVGYLLMLLSPLRLLSDSVVYLSMADGIRLDEHHQSYPPGYPLLLRGAEHLGLGSAWGFVALNLILLTLAVTAIYQLCRRRLGCSAARAAAVCLAVLLCHTVSQATPEMMSEIPYLAFAMLCLLALSEAEPRAGRRRLVLLFLGILLAAAAISIRVQGVALVPPVLFAAVSGRRLSRLWLAGRRRPAMGASIAGGVLVVLGALVVLGIAASPYGLNVSHAWGLRPTVSGTVTHLRIEMTTKLMSLGELVGQTNCCSNTTHPLGPLLTLAGLASLGVLVLGWLARRRFGVVELFVLSTGAVILVYNGAAPRFWIAALPFLIVYATFAAERWWRFRPVRYAVALYAVAFTLAGVGWLLDSAYISTAGRQFPRVWAAQLAGVPRLQAAYRVAFGEPTGANPVTPMPAAVQLLRRYEPLARHPGG